LDTYIDKELKLLIDAQFVKEFVKIFNVEVIYDKKIVDKKLIIKDLSKFLSKIKGLETRENQINMSNIIDTSFKEKTKIAIEAPT